MSETVRSYSGSEMGPRHGLSRAGRGPGKFIVAGVLFALLGYGYWCTRDSCPMERVIPAKQAYYVHLNDPLGQRSMLAASKIWQAVPSTTGAARLTDLLNMNLGAPEWMLRNLAPHACHVSGKNVETFQDMLFVSQMTRIGCLLAKMRGLIPGIRSDPAGGLHLSRVGDAGVYFAVRGRTLAVSPSRDALIRALTLRPEDAVSAQAMAAAAKASKDDLSGSIALNSTDPLGNVIQSVRFALRIEPAAAQLKCCAALRPEWQSRATALLSAVSPYELRAPLPGLCRISLNLGKPVRELGDAIAGIAGQTETVAAFWHEASPNGSAWSAAKTLLGSLGPGICMSWTGMDLNEMIPMPQVVLTLDADPASVMNVFAAMPPLSSQTPGDRIPHYDPETKRATVSIIGGPSMEPMAGLLGDALLIGSSRPVAESLLDTPQTRESLPNPGNLYVSISPKPCVEAIVSLAALLVENNLIREQAAKTFQDEAPAWQTAANALEEISALVSYEKGDATAEFSVRCAR